MNRNFLVTAAGVLAGLLVIGEAAAGPVGYVGTIEGSGGRRAVHGVAVDRNANSVSSVRGTATNGGRGAVTTRDAVHGGNNYYGSSQTTFANGSSISRSSAAHANGDGSASYSASRTGLDGETRTVSGDIYAPR